MVITPGERGRPRRPSCGRMRARSSPPAESSTGRVRRPQDPLDEPVDQSGEQPADRAEHHQQQHDLHPERLSDDPRLHGVDAVEDVLPAHLASVFRHVEPTAIDASSVPGTRDTVWWHASRLRLRPVPDAPLDSVVVGERPEPGPRPGWVRVAVRAASLNRHDLWTLRGVGIKPDQFPMILGCDGAGTLDDGTAW